MIAPIALAFAGLAAAAPFSLPNGFPNLSGDALNQVSEAAGGTLPNTPLPTSLPADAVTTLQVIAYNEIFEVAFFSSLLANVTNGVDGFTDLKGMDKDYVTKILSAVVAQEELHATGANAILASANATTIPACNYMFPTTDFISAIALADLFTEVVLGTLQSVSTQFAMDGASTQPLVQLIASIIGQEAEQAGGYRMIEGRIPSSAPFLTTSTGEFAFNAIAQNFIVPGSCDSVFETIGVPMLDTLVINGMPGDTNQTVTFTTSCTHTTEGADFLAYISGQNSPVIVPISNVQVNGDMATFEASLPFANGFAKGLTIAALVNTTDLATAADVTAVAFAGPGLIQVD